RAKIVYVCNLMTRPNQTAGFNVTDFAAEIERYAGAPILDYVIYNTQKPSRILLERYALEGEREPVEYDRTLLSQQHYIAVGEPLLSKKPAKRNPNEKFLSRTLIRHDSDRLARLIMRIYFS
ncbi:MAG TPA: 2-phospho-L-lactate transferase CofD family protein, partial [Puia sp.]|nr:2-phospho-L-lactate transferase CofD family protein [Puia sp.]